MTPLEKETLLADVGYALRRMRLHQDRTRKEIAAYLNITPQAYGNMERGRIDICITKLIQLAKFYDLPLLKLISHEFQSKIVLMNNKLLEKGILISGKLTG